ncbi:MAG: hypothetical protein IKE43_01320 [Coriobacteriales bacterium]|nr:hypothetical protein [Coriobacteriales bacterium]
MARTFAVLGDSISTFEGYNPHGFAVYYSLERAREAGLAGVEDTWWSLVAAYFGATVTANGSYSGSMVAGAGFPAAWSAERIESLQGSASPSDILVFMGTNDYGWGSARAQAQARSSATPPCTDLSHYPAKTAGSAGEQELKEFEQAYGVMLDGLAAVYPQATVWCMTLIPGRVTGHHSPTFAWNLRGIPMQFYNEAIKSIATGHGCKALDLCSYGLDYEALDGTHPTALGMKQIAALVIAAMEQKPGFAGIFANNPYQNASQWISKHLCPERSCLNCPHAKGTGNTWYCVCEK